MRRDPIFYSLFQRRPQLLFELTGLTPENAQGYRFDSVAVKEPKFEIDGVFLPPEDSPGTIYFAEVQFQPDPCLYERLFAESHLYFYRSQGRYLDWQAVLIYPTRATEQENLHPHRSLLNGDQVHRVYLDELGDARGLPVPIAAAVLTIVEEATAAEVACDILARAQSDEFTDLQRRDIIDIVTAIIMYKFTNLNQAEVKEMLGLNLTEEPRAIREAKAEGRDTGLEEGRKEGREEGAIGIVMHLLSRRLGQDIPIEMTEQLAQLPLASLTDLSEALFDFTTLTDLQTWLSGHPSA
jgi:predicted transposase/invertase (TIGR01784 family)